ncbi:type II toxin-antitoxin system Phd/YefM family antitoxin [Rhizobium sp. TRM96647]|uniref:type II toxin-antitoxin system Phd/YefM family antitoxin n=1 Tax=unclassified Rhizobium TaxID=2613769 RepID=UPI0021E7C45A|nr:MULTISPECIES: type II toxin-antitoxin system Phd/YefM family antitoxin [unclassified Rhizobium]MCV3738123.1 type II toxin-antitoxin system Phd/YefM family antitoxin [Rhizobium sp. TRM96647]MCV3759810.1 type II toxin-antitoxin system Phd/YefM family antitoxin [Rhizobium sp. TRM96650]
MRTVALRDARSNFSKLVRDIQHGAETEIVITRAGKPVARILPVENRKRVGRRLGLMQGKFPPLTLEDLNALDPVVASLFGVAGEQG